MRVHYQTAMSFTSHALHVTAIVLHHCRSAPVDSDPTSRLEPPHLARQPDLLSTSKVRTINVERVDDRHQVLNMVILVLTAQQEICPFSIREDHSPDMNDTPKLVYGGIGPPSLASLKFILLVFWLKADAVPADDC